MKGVRETFSRYDSADYLKTEADITAYLEACAQEAPNDPVFAYFGDRDRSFRSIVTGWCQSLCAA